MAASSSASQESRYQTAWCYIPEHCNFYMYCCENLKYHRIQSANMNRRVRKHQSSHLKYSERIQHINITKKVINTNLKEGNPMKFNQCTFNVFMVIPSKILKLNVKNYTYTSVLKRNKIPHQ